MRLDFNVLWVDDQPRQLDAQIYKIRQDMYEHGFEFKVTNCVSIAEVEAKIADGVFSDEIDLIFVDWDLGHGETGQEAIAKIRDVVRYKDIIFYSSRTETSNLKKFIYEAGVDGVYVASKDGLVRQVGGVFEGLVKKVLDLDHMRGIVMGATSDIDNMVNECLTLIHGKTDEAEREKLFAKAQSLVSETLKDLEKKAKKLEGCKDLAELLGAHDILQANDRIRMIGDLLKDGKYNDHEPARTGLKSYMGDGMKKRNVLAHVVLTPEGRPEGIATSEGKVIKIEEMRTLRVFLLDLRVAMRKLRVSLSG